MYSKDVKKSFKKAIAERKRIISQQRQKQTDESITSLFDEKSIQHYLPTTRKTPPKIRAFSPKDLYKPNFAELWLRRLYDQLMRVAEFYTKERGQPKAAAELRQAASKLGVFQLV